MAKTEILRNKKGQEICGGKKRSGAPCGQTRLSPNGRCRNHGGTNPPPGPAHPLWRNGRGSKFLQKMPMHLRKTFKRSLDDPNVLSLQAELGLIDSRLVDLLEKLSTGESAEKIELLSLNLTELHRMVTDEEDDEIDVDATVELIERMHSFLSSIMGDRSTWAEIRETIETRRRVSDTERKLLEAQQHAIDAVQLRSLVTFFLGSLRDHVMPLEGGREAILAVTADIRQLMSDASPERDEELDPTKGIEA